MGGEGLRVGVGVGWWGEPTIYICIRQIYLRIYKFINDIVCVYIYIYIYIQVLYIHKYSGGEVRVG